MKMKNVIALSTFLIAFAAHQTFAGQGCDNGIKRCSSIKCERWRGGYGHGGSYDCHHRKRTCHNTCGTCKFNGDHYGRWCRAKDDICKYCHYRGGGAGDSYACRCPKGKCKGKHTTYWGPQFGGFTDRWNSCDRWDKRRRLQDSSVEGPCNMFIQKKNPSCPAIPTLIPDMHNKPDGLSSYAHDWIKHTCCKIVTEPLSGIFAAVWLWKQVCTKSLSSGTAESYRLDEEWYQKHNNLTMSYSPLKTMADYCPNDLEGGALNEWSIQTFYPVMKAYNQHYKVNVVVSKCIVKKKSLGAVTLLLRAPSEGVDFGHLSMVLHDDHNLLLPVDLDTKHYVSFTAAGSTSSALTGSKAEYDGFGTELKEVTSVITLYDADTNAMVKEWDIIKKSGQMYDFVDWNCARAVMEVLRSGFPDCNFPVHQLMEPSTAFGYVEEAKTTDVISTKTITVESIRSRHIYPPTQSNSGDDGIPVMTVVAITLTTVFGSLAIAVIVSGVVICKLKGDAEKELEGSLAGLLLSLTMNGGSGDKGQSVGKILPQKTLGTAITEDMDSSHDGKVDFREFSEWAQKNKLTEKQTKLLWQDLDKNHNNSLSKDEWYTFVDKRPNLKFLISRLRNLNK